MALAATLSQPATSEGFGENGRAFQNLVPVVDDGFDNAGFAW